MAAILVVDEDDMVRQLMRRVLETCGHTVFTSPNGFRAMLVCEERPGALALLVCATQLPDMLGLELARLARSPQPTMSVLFLARASESTPMLDTLRRPVRCGELIAQVEERLRARDVSL